MHDTEVRNVFELSTETEGPSLVIIRPQENDGGIILSDSTRPSSRSLKEYPHFMIERIEVSG